jgi:hypothetical protein
MQPTSVDEMKQYVPLKYTIYALFDASRSKNRAKLMQI